MKRLENWVVVNCGKIGVLKLIIKSLECYERGLKFMLRVMGVLFGSCKISFLGGSWLSRGRVRGRKKDILFV